MEQKVIKSHSYVVVDMKEYYPFAVVQSATEQTVLVRKNLIYEGNNQLNIIQKMKGILQSLEHENLIGFKHAAEMAPNTYSFFYEYVPLNIDKWLLDMGEDVLEQLQFQLMNLVGYLTSNGLKFNFDPCCVGLSKDIKIKYFLKEFTIHNENKLANYKENQRKIASFFQELRQSQQQSFEEKSQGKLDRGSFESRKMDSFKTRESWSIQSFMSDISFKSNQSEQMKGKLTSRIQDSKKRSLQLLARIKGLKDKLI